MQCMKMLNLSMFKLIKHLAEKSKGLRWGTEYLFFFLLISPQAPIIIFLLRGRGVEDLEDHMIFRETEESGYTRILQSLD